MHPQRRPARPRARRASARPRSRDGGTPGPSRRRGCRSRPRAGSRPSPSTRCASRGGPAPRARARRRPRPACAPSTARSPAGPPCVPRGPGIRGPFALVHVLQAAVRERAVGGVRAHAEEDVAAQPDGNACAAVAAFPALLVLHDVGMTGFDQTLDVGDDLLHRLGGQRLVVGAPEPERVGVGAVVRGHLRRQLDAGAPRASYGAGARGVGAGGVVDLVVDVGDVDDQRHLQALVFEEALHQAEDDERARVADVDAAVDGRPAHVDADPPGVARVQRQELAAAGVVQADLAHDLVETSRLDSAASDCAGWRSPAPRHPRRDRRSRSPRRWWP